MSATTPNFGIPYPTTDDQIRLIPGQLQALATKVDTTMYGAGPRSGTSLASIDTNNATIGQQAYVYDSDETKKAHAGPYWYYGGQWTRPAQAAVIFTLTQNDDWAVESWQWQTFGQPYVYLRVTAKHNIEITDNSGGWPLGTLTQTEYTPPAITRLPSFTNQKNANFCFQVSGRGLTLETYETGYTFWKGRIIFAMLTWPCPNIGAIRTYTTS